jgi:hypothetical protein
MFFFVPIFVLIASFLEYMKTGKQQEKGKTQDGEDEERNQKI